MQVTQAKAAARSRARKGTLSARCGSLAYRVARCFFSILFIEILLFLVCKFYFYNFKILVGTVFAFLER